MWLGALLGGCFCLLHGGHVLVANWVTRTAAEATPVPWGLQRRSLRLPTPGTEGNTATQADEILGRACKELGPRGCTPHLPRCSEAPAEGQEVGQRGGWRCANETVENIYPPFSPSPSQYQLLKPVFPG